MEPKPGVKPVSEGVSKREISPETRAKMSENAKKQEKDPITGRFIKSAKEGIKDPDKAREKLEDIDKTAAQAILTQAGAEGTMAEMNEKKVTTKEQSKRYSKLEQDVKDADAKIKELKNDSNPVNKALGYDVEIHTVKESLIQANESIQLVEKVRDLPDQTPEKKAAAEKRLEELKIQKAKVEENLRDLETQRKEIKKDGQDIPDQLVRFVEDIAGEVTSDQKGRPLKLLNDIMDNAVANEKSRRELIDRLKKKGILDNKQAKKLNDDLRIEIPDWAKRIKNGGMIGLGGLLMMIWMAFKSSSDTRQG